MKNRVIASLIALGVLSLSACSTSIIANPCTLWVADNGPYLVKYTVKAGQNAACVASQALDGTYDEISAQMYPLSTGWEVDMVPAAIISGPGDTITDPSGKVRAPGVTLAKGNFSQTTVDAANQCTVPTMTTATNHDSSVTLKLSNVVFSEDAVSQGASFGGDVDITMNGCTASYTVTALAPEITCATNDDCLPLADPSKGRFVASGLAGSFHTYCDTGASAQAFTFDPKSGSSSGLCFLADPFPSLCPSGSFEGAPGSACSVGK